MKRYLSYCLWMLGGLVLLVALAYAGLTIYMHRTQPQLYAAPIYDEVAPILPQLTAGHRILVFSKTNGYRHIEAIAAANELLQKMALKNSWEIFLTENAAVFNKNQLEKFDAVIWNNASGPLLTGPQQKAFKEWLEQGGGYLGIHGAGGDFSYDWQWYVQEVIRAQFVMHPIVRRLQSVRVNIEAPENPITAGLSSWVHEDEWYNFKASPRNRVTVLASIDESTYSPEIGAMGADHPVIWCHSIEKGRVVYSALGHDAEAYSDPVYERLLENALNWILDSPASGS